MRNTSKFRFVFTRASTYSPNVVFCCWWGGAPPPNLQFVVWGSFHPSHYANLGGLGLTRGPLKGAVRGAGADQGPSEGGSLPCCLCPSGPGGGGGAKRPRRDPNEANPGRVLKRVPGFTYLCPAGGSIIFAHIFMHSSFGVRHCRGGGPACTSMSYSIQLCITMHTTCVNICEHSQIYVYIYKCA